MHIRQLFAFQGPNRYHPTPAVVAFLIATANSSAAVIFRIKETAQTIGVVIGSLDVIASPAESHWLLEVQFRTPMPALGAALLRYVVFYLQADLGTNPNWDAEQALWELQQQRRAQAIPLPTLQLIAEARARGVPVIWRTDRHLQLGYGCYGLKYSSQIITPDWQHLGGIAIHVVSGPHTLALETAQRWQQTMPAATLLADGTFRAIQDALCDPATSELIVVLNHQDVYWHGLAFESCETAIITGLAELELSAHERLLLAGLPLLVTAPHGRVYLNRDMPELQELVQYTRAAVHTIPTKESLW
jgi:hypothetical protein